MEPVRTGAKNAIVELSRNPEQLLGEIAPRVRPKGVISFSKRTSTEHLCWMASNSMNDVVTD